MAYKVSIEFGCVYRLNKDGQLEWAPLYKNGLFDFDEEGGVVERPNDEVPEWYYEQVVSDLGGNHA